MSSKTARKSMTAAQAAAPDKIKLTAEQAIREVQNLRRAHLFISNMEYVDLLLAEYTRLKMERVMLEDEVIALRAQLASDVPSASEEPVRWELDV